MSNKFFIINSILFIFLFIFTPVLDVLLNLMQYNHSSTYSDFSWILPFLTLIPLTYLFIALYYLIRKKFLKSFMFTCFFLLLLSLFSFLYGKKEIEKDYTTMFSKIGIIKK